MGFGVQGYPMGVPSLDCLRKRFSRFYGFYRFYRFYRFKGEWCGAQNLEAPRNIETNLKRVPPWRRGRPKAGIDCPEGAELCRMVKRTYGITGKRSDTDEVNPATMDCASSRHSILRLWRGPSPRACSDEKNYAVRKPNPPFLPAHFCFQTSGFRVSPSGVPPFDCV